MQVCIDGVVHLESIGFGSRRGDFVPKIGTRKKKSHSRIFISVSIVRLTRRPREIRSVMFSWINSTILQTRHGLGQRRQTEVTSEDFRTDCTGISCYATSWNFTSSHIRIVILHGYVIQRHGQVFWKVRNSRAPTVHNFDGSPIADIHPDNIFTGEGGNQSSPSRVLTSIQPLATQRMIQLYYRPLANQLPKHPLLRHVRRQTWSLTRHFSWVKRWWIYWKGHGIRLAHVQVFSRRDCGPFQWYGRGVEPPRKVYRCHC